MIKYIHEGKEPPVVTIGKGHHYIAQGRHFKLQRIVTVAGNMHTALVVQRIINRQACIAVRQIRKKRLFMTTTAFLLKDVVAQLLRQQKCCFTPHYLVVLAIAAYQHQHILAQCFGHTLGIDERTAKCRREHLFVFGILLQFLNYTRQRFTHFI